MKSSLYFMPVLFIATCYLLYRNYLKYKKESEIIKSENELLKMEKRTLKGVVKESSKNIENVIKRSSKIFSITVDGISKSDIKLLKKNSRQVIKLNEEVDVLQDKIFNYLKSNEKGNEKATELYLVILEKLTQTTKNLRKISRRTLKHVEEDRRKLPLSNIKILLNLKIIYLKLMRCTKP